MKIARTLLTVVLACLFAAGPGAAWARAADAEETPPAAQGTEGGAKAEEPAPAAPAATTATASSEPAAATGVASPEPRASTATAAPGEARRPGAKDPDPEDETEPGVVTRGANPKIRAVEPDHAFAGQVITVAGLNFSDALADVTAQLGNEPLIVLEAGFEKIKMILPPTAKKGKYPLFVTIGGRISAPVDVVIRPESERPQKNKEDLVDHEMGDAQRLGLNRPLDLDPPDAAEDRGSLYVRVSGAARIPDGCVIALKLKLRQEIITGIELPVKGQRFEGAFGPFTRELFAGTYMVDAEFRLADQSKQMRDAFRKYYKDPRELAAKEAAGDRKAVRIGSVAQEEAEEQAMRKHVALNLARVRMYVRDLEAGFAAAGRPAFRKKEGGHDEAGWEAWLMLRSLRSTAPAERPARLLAWKKRKGFENADGTFSEARWREWLDHGFRAEVLACARNHFAYKDRYLAMKRADVMTLLEELIASVMAFSQARSRVLYELYFLPHSQADGDELQGADVLRVGGASRVSPASIEVAARKVAKELGLSITELQAAADEVEANEGGGR